MKVSSIPNTSVQQVSQPSFQNQRLFILLPTGWGKCSNLWCLHDCKMHLRVKKMKGEIFTQTSPSQNSHQGSYHHPLDRGKLSIHPVFFRKSIQR